MFPMTDVHAVAIDTSGSSPRVFAAITNEHFGPPWSPAMTWASPGTSRTTRLSRSPRKRVPRWPGVADRAEAAGHLRGRRAVGVVPVDRLRPDVRAGAALWEHPHREKWTSGGGGMMIHTILPRPTDDQKVTVAMSTGGVYRTEDGGKSWNAANHGVRADFLHCPFPEYGQCVQRSR
jgi:hypothetical protein